MKNNYLYLLCIFLCAIFMLMILFFYRPYNKNDYKKEIINKKEMPIEKEIPSEKDLAYEKLWLAGKCSYCSLPLEYEKIDFGRYQLSYRMLGKQKIHKSCYKVHKMLTK